jgi:hypothetical protein
MNFLIKRKNKSKDINEIKDTNIITNDNININIDNPLSEQIISDDVFLSKQDNKTIILFKNGIYENNSYTTIEWDITNKKLLFYTDDILYKTLPINIFFNKYSIVKFIEYSLLFFDIIDDIDNVLKDTTNTNYSRLIKKDENYIMLVGNINIKEVFKSFYKKCIKMFENDSIYINLYYHEDEKEIFYDKYNNSDYVRKHVIENKLNLLTEYSKLSEDITNINNYEDAENVIIEIKKILKKDKYVIENNIIELFFENKDFKNKFDYIIKDKIIYFDESIDGLKKKLHDMLLDISLIFTQIYIVGKMLKDNNLISIFYGKTVHVSNIRYLLEYWNNFKLDMSKDVELYDSFYEEPVKNTSYEGELDNELASSFSTKSAIPSYNPTRSSYKFH